MDIPTKLKYHQAAFDLLGQEAVVSRQALRRIEKAEADCGRRMPGSVREWCSLRNPGALVPRGHRPPPLADTLRSFAAGERLSLGGDGGDSEWFVKPDGPDDPPVVVEENFGLPDDGERACGTHFSAFLFAWAWDRVTLHARLFPDGFGLHTHGHPTGLMELDFLRDHFQEGPDPGYPGLTNGFFFRAGERVWVQKQGDPRSPGPAFWQLTADSADGLARLLRRLWPCLAAATNLGGRSKPALAVLEQVRRELGAAPAAQ